MDAIFERHQVGSEHPEHAGRVQAIARELEQQGLLSELVLLPAQCADAHLLQRIHGADYIRQVAEAAARGKAYLHTPECPISQETYQVALHAVGSVLDATTRVCRGDLDNAFVAARPPGHHAEQAEAMGFCYFNNVAIAADFALQELGLARVLIFDFDVHHGNGTQHLFEGRRDVLYASVHQHPRTCYPGTGYAHERGWGDGLGYTLNVPLLPYTQDAEFIARFEAELLPAFRVYRPECIMLSAGFDAHQDDPLAQLMLTQRSFDHVARACKQLALELGHGRVMSVLEGGYHVKRLAESVASQLAILRDDAHA